MPIFLSTILEQYSKLTPIVLSFSCAMQTEVEFGIKSTAHTSRYIAVPHTETKVVNASSPWLTTSCAQKWR